MPMEDIKKRVEKLMKDRFRGKKISDRFNSDPEEFSSLIAAGFKIKQPESRHRWNAKAQASSRAYQKYYKPNRLPRVPNCTFLKKLS